MKGQLMAYLSDKLPFLFRQPLRPITPLDVIPAKSPNVHLQQEAERGRNFIVQNVILAGNYLAKAQNTAAQIAAEELREL